MTHYFIEKQSKKENGYPKTKCFRIMGVSRSGYYNWLATYEDRDGTRKQKEIEENQFKEKIRLIIRKLGFIPGKRTFRTHLWRDYGLVVNVKKIRRLMTAMNLVANRPKKDAYKGQATHYHECASKQNLVNQDFKKGPRQVILTDITYLYYGNNRTCLYLCAFKDAYTSEILGYHVDKRMTVELVKNAYQKMMENHEKELKNQLKVYIHSDQGSQYLATDFQELLTNDGFIQSMSDRGNSQDNAPMESFFGRMKCEILDIIARCVSEEDVVRLIDGYMNTFNTQRYQYTLAGLTPSEYYQYCATGIYPLDNYFGVKADDLMTIEKLVESKLERLEEKKKKSRKLKEVISLEPSKIIARDQRKVRSELKKWKNQKTLVDNQIKKLQELFEKTKRAVKFYINATNEIQEELKNPQNWKKYIELDYVNDLAALY